MVGVANEGWGKNFGAKYRARVRARLEQGMRGKEGPTNKYVRTPVAPPVLYDKES